MKKSIILFSIFFLQWAMAFAQTYQWAKSIGGISLHKGNNITTDNLGNVYITGHFSGTTDFDPGAGIQNVPFSGGTDIFFAKYDGNGNYIWANSIGSTSSDVGFGIVTDASGNVYITGNFYGTVDFDPGAGTQNLISMGNNDIFFAKYDTGGNYIWAKSIGSTNADGGKNITLDASGNVYIIGDFLGTADFDPGSGTQNLTSSGWFDIFFAKYDANGNYQWAKRVGGSGYDYGYSIDTDTFGNVYITGNFQGTADFDPGSGTQYLASAGSSDIFFAKYDGGGNYQWAKRIGSTSYDVGFGITIDDLVNVYITGGFYDTVDFDPGASTMNFTSLGSMDIFLAKYDSSGNYQWAKSIGSTNYDYGKGIDTDAQGNVYVTGLFEDTANFDPGSGVENLTSSGLYDIFFAKYDANGNYEWANSIGSTDYDRGISIVTDAPGNLYITGYFRDVADFDPGDSTQNLISGGSDDIFFAKYSDFPLCDTITFTFTTQVPSCNGGNDGSVSVSASGGATPYLYSWSTGATTSSIANLAAGTYFITVIDANNCYAIDSINISEPDSLRLFTLSTDAAAGQNDGTASVSVSGGISPYSYLWNNGKTTQTITGLAPGNYSVTVTDANACQSIADVIVNENTGINEYKLSSKVFIYPNPFNSSTTITINNQNKISYKLEILNILGEKVRGYRFTSNTLTIKKGNLRNGIYFYILTDNNQSIDTGKLIIN
ncbi:SBBP repeat-containing protein [Candidatus Amoebophilus asiaticus]|nr:SBBP repeat-containing protein [Candidatus Amoebophilus asiaticus]